MKRHVADGWAIRGLGNWGGRPVMVSKRRVGERILYICDECGLGYRERGTDVACEAPL